MHSSFYHAKSNQRNALLALNQESESPTYWMDMLKTMSETLRIGLVVSDMFVPGCPLAHLNEGFAAQTGTYVLGLCLLTNS